MLCDDKLGRTGVPVDDFVCVLGFGGLACCCWVAFPEPALVDMTDIATLLPGFELLLTIECGFGVVVELVDVSKRDVDVGSDALAILALVGPLTGGTGFLEGRIVVVGVGGLDFKLLVPRTPLDDNDGLAGCIVTG